MTNRVLQQGRYVSTKQSDSKSDSEVETLESIKSEIRNFITSVLGNQSGYNASANGSDPVQEIMRRMS